MKVIVPEPALLRMPLYVYALKQMRLAEPDRVTVSATRFEEILQFNASQVRKDLAYTGLVGRPRIGYVVTELIEALERLIGWDVVREAYLVGAGHLGAALLAHERIVSHGVKVVAAFDVDPVKVGRDFVGLPTYHVEELPRRAREASIEIGIVAVPHAHAQYVADLMFDGGIRGIWNFAPIRLNVAAGVIVQNEDIFSSVVMLSRRIAAEDH
ncbi:MAG: redox-sensing transcriptional repressor Rex [Proteobacteria bacterium]|nr:redox-sensing transcriptional repressor Rex [Pseudomonadota bacterium]